ncbi:MAG: CoA-binding protein [Rhodothermaceae bacterium]|nr:CoA-binding protein [Rhodothermaceae bacterium]
MENNKELIADFLAQKNIAVAGISLSRDTPANIIFKKMKKAGYTVFPVNPKGGTFMEQSCYSNLGSIHPKPDGVVIVTRPGVTAELVDECIRLGIPRVWIHNMMGTVNNGKPGNASSVDIDAVQKGREAGLKVISGSCPMQFVPPVDIFHRCIRWISDKTGKL